MPTGVHRQRSLQYVAVPPTHPPTGLSRELLVKNCPLVWNFHRSSCLWEGEAKPRIIVVCIHVSVHEPSSQNKLPPLPQTDVKFCITVYYTFFMEIQRTGAVLTLTHTLSSLSRIDSFVLFCFFCIRCCGYAPLSFIWISALSQARFLSHVVLFCPFTLDCVTYIGGDLIAYICCNRFCVLK